MSNEYARLKLAKYHIISFILSLICLIFFVYFIKYLPETSREPNQINYLIWFIIFLIAATYFEAYIVTGILFMKSTFNKNKVYIINTDILIPIINIKYFLKMRNYNSKFLIFDTLFVGSGISMVYAIYFYFKNRKKYN